MEEITLIFRALFYVQQNFEILANKSLKELCKKSNNINFNDEWDMMKEMFYEVFNGDIVLYIKHELNNHTCDKNYSRMLIVLQDTILMKKGIIKKLGYNKKKYLITEESLRCVIDGIYDLPEIISNETCIKIWGIELYSEYEKSHHILRKFYQNFDLDTYEEYLEDKTLSYGTMQYNIIDFILSLDENNRRKYINYIFTY